MSGECEKCWEHCLDCQCNLDEQVKRLGSKIIIYGDKTLTHAEKVKILKEYFARDNRLHCRPARTLS